MAPRDTENNAYAKFWGVKQRALWYVMVFLEWSIMYVLFSRKVATIVNGWYSFKDQSARYGLKGDLSPVILIRKYFTTA